MKKILSLFAIFMVAMTSWADDVKYIDANGDEQTCSSYTAVTTSTTELSGWCVVNSSVTISSAVTCSGDVNLILADGASLSVKGVYVGADHNFTVYGQSAGTGALTSTATGRTSGIGGAGIGSAANAITINGGKITATGYAGCAGIGTDGIGNVTSITINGGTVTATGGNIGAGIGAGYEYNQAQSCYYTTNVGTITINGGVITATGGSEAAGIGTSDHPDNSTTCNQIIINGGYVVANGYADSNGMATTHGIGNGSGSYTNCGSVTIGTNQVVLMGTAANPTTEITNDGTNLVNTLNKRFVIVKTDYLCFTSQYASTTVAFNKTGTVSAAFQYSTDLLTWSDYTFGNSITLSNAGDKVYFRAKGTNSTVGTETSNYITFTSDKNVAASGNVMSLLSANCTVTTVPASAFRNLFRDCAYLIAAPKLPAQIMSSRCYENMFYGCTGITTAPALPATTLAEYCYSFMFHGCTSLTTAPELPATTLAQNCYSSMFYGCTSLTTAPELPATTLVSYCYDSMFYNCTALNSVKVNFTRWNPSGVDQSTYLWFCGMENTIGTFTCPVELYRTMPQRSYNYIREGWIIDNPEFKVGTNAVALPVLSSATVNHTFTAPSSGDYTFTLSTTDNGAQFRISNSSTIEIGNSTQSSNGVVTLTNVQTGTKYYFSVSATSANTISDATMTITQANIKDKAVYNNGTLTFYCDETDHSSEGTVYKITEYPTAKAPIWNDATTQTGVTAVVFDSSFANTTPTSCYNWFDSFANLATVTGINNVNISNVTTFKGMFGGCHALTAAPFPTGITTVDESAYSNCTSLESVTIPSTVTTISTTAFSGCTSLATVTIPATVTAIGASAFDGCTALANVNLSSVPTVGTSTFNSSCVYNLSLTDDSYVATGSTSISSAATAAYTRTMANQWGTIVLPFDATNGDNYDLYTLDTYTGEVINLTKVSGTLAAGHPALVRIATGTKGQTGNLHITASNTNVSTTLTSGTSTDGHLYIDGTYTTVHLTAGYIIANDLFWSVSALGNTVNCSPFRAYITYSGNAKIMGIGTDEDVTAIETLNAITEGTAEYYDINGRRIADLQKGINIVKYGNGVTKKVLVK